MSSGLVGGFKVDPWGFSRRTVALLPPSRVRGEHLQHGPSGEAGRTTEDRAEGNTSYSQRERKMELNLHKNSPLQTCRVSLLHSPSDLFLWEPEQPHPQNTSGGRSTTCAWCRLSSMWWPGQVTRNVDGHSTQREILLKEDILSDGTS